LTKTTSAIPCRELKPTIVATSDSKITTPNIKVLTAVKRRKAGMRSECLKLQRELQIYETSTAEEKPARFEYKISKAKNFTVVTAVTT